MPQLQEGGLSTNDAWLLVFAEKEASLFLRETLCGNLRHGISQRIHTLRILECNNRNYCPPLTWGQVLC